MSSLMKILIEAGPLAVFFIVNSWAGIFHATGAFMIAVVAALIVSHVRTRKLPMMPLVSALIVMVFGGLTLYLHNETFIKLKPTILYSLFAGALLFGLLKGKSFLKPVFEAGFPPLTEEGWNKLTYRWALFFVALAILNEIIWRNVSTDAWVNFKVFGLLPLTVLFALAQTPLVMRHTVKEKDGA
ncbi:MAG: septation protein A [Sphingomonadales bacterium]